MHFFRSLSALVALLAIANGASAQQPAPPKKPPAAKPDAAAPEGEKKPAQPGAKPAQPGAKPAQPGAKPAQPGAKPAQPGAKPAQPGAKPGQPAKPPAAADAEEDAEGEEAAGEGVEGEEDPELGDPPPPPPGPPGTRVQPGQTPGTGAPGTGFGPMPMWPQPGVDSRELEQQGAARPADQKKKSTDEERVYAEDWWSHARPIFEIHGYYRLRAELFHNFSLGRIDSPNTAIWPMPADNRYFNGSASFGPSLCTPDESEQIGGGTDDPREGRYPCKNKTQAGANMRFRLNPELHVSDNLRVVAQIDLLDNLVLGSTPEGYSNSPGANGGYQVNQRSGYSPLGAFETTQVPPSAGRNSFTDSVQVKRAWAEYLTPVGQLRFGRMPSHWGLGILANSGDKYDDDYQTTADRIMFVTGIKSLDLYFGAAWDFANEGPTSASHALPQGQPYDVAQLDDVDQYVFVVMRRKNPELTKLALAQGNLVLNGGLYVVHRRQLLANDLSGDCNQFAATLGCPTEQFQQGYTRRGASAWIPDLWIQLLYKKFRFELEAVTIQGSLENTGFSGGTSSNYTQAPGGEGWKIRQWGIAGEIEQKLVEDRLRLGFWSGWASGDAEADTGAGTNELNPGIGGFQPQKGDETISTFRFHPTYHVDLILWRNLLNRVQGAYYFRPSVEYDFVREDNGQRFGGGFAAIWSRASEFVQTPGHKRDLGVELNLSLYYQSKDGAMNDDPEKMGGFFTMLQWGVLFPMGGLGYQSEESRRFKSSALNEEPETSTAQILRWYLGVFF